MKIAKIEILKSLGAKLPVGEVVDVETDDNGIPLQQFWRKRFREADESFELVKKKASSTAAVKGDGS